MNYNDGLSASDVALLSGNRYSGGAWGDNGSWWIILFLIFAFAGWGGRGFGGNDNGAIPYIMNNATDSGLQRGFDQNAIMSGINSLNTAVNTGFSNQAVGQCNQTTTLLQSINGLQNQLCDNRYDITSAITNTGYALNNTMMANEMARQQCCCETKQAIADLKYTVATENCSDRAVLQEGVRDIIASSTANTQLILDKLCQQEIDAKDDIINNLRTQINMQNLAASQTAQTAQLIADNNAQTRDLINRIAPYPQPSFLVGNPYAYNGYTNYNCGCNCGNL